MLMMTGVGPFDRAENDALHMLNVPTASISMTVLKPFGDSLEAGARKFPAAQFTKMSNFPKVSRHRATAASPSCRGKSAPLHTALTIVLAKIGEHNFAYLT